jgi:hypothetical protein
VSVIALTAAPTPTVQIIVNEYKKPKSIADQDTFSLQKPVGQVRKAENTPDSAAALEEPNSPHSISTHPYESVSTVTASTSH